jgi:hypothetical protein
MKNEQIIKAFIKAFCEFQIRGQITSKICLRVCEILKCNPAELTKALDANDDELRNEIACM